MRKISLVFPAFFVLAALAGCGAGRAVRETLAGPKTSPMGYPAALVPSRQQIVAEPEPQPASANSLWRAGARTFFHDQRARNVGDILTVEVNINDNAQFGNETNRSRVSSQQAGVPNFFGLESSLGKIFPKINPASIVNTNDTATSDGKGTITRTEQVKTTLAAVVTQVLPNGNLIIQGSQEVTNDNELRRLTISGIVRPEDITSANTIRQDQIAEARINYGGKGDVSQIQKAPAAQRLMEKFLPF